MVAGGVPHTDPVDDAVVLGGVLLLLVGILSVIQGVAALSGSGALAGAPELIVGGSSTLGTALALLGGAAGLIAVSLWAGAAVRWIAVAVAAANGIAQLLFMPAYPFWSLAVFALDVVAIFALVTGTQPQHERTHRG